MSTVTHIDVHKQSEQQICTTAHPQQLQHQREKPASNESTMALRIRAAAETRTLQSTRLFSPLPARSLPSVKPANKNMLKLWGMCLVLIMLGGTDIARCFPPL
jgi:hypothetical protein